MQPYLPVTPRTCATDARCRVRPRHATTCHRLRAPTYLALVRKRVKAPMP